MLSITSHNNLPPSSSFLYSIAHRKLMLLIIILVILDIGWLVVYLRPASTEKTVAEQVAEQVAEAENPFKADNPLSNVEVNPFEKTKKVLNPFTQ